MASETELGVLLKPDTSELEDVEDRQINVPLQDGGTARGRRGGGGSAAAGGFAGAEAGELLGKGGIIAGLLAGVLSQLKPITQFVKLIFRVLSLALLPAIQLLVVALRPLLTNLAKTTQAVENPGRTGRLAAEQFQRDVSANPSGSIGAAASIGFPGIGPGTGQQIGSALGGGVEAIQSVIEQQPNSADHTDEGKKNQQANLVQDVLELIP